MRKLALASLVALVLGGCASQDPTVVDPSPDTTEVLSVQVKADETDGNTFELSAKADNLEIAPASDGNEDAAHFHLFIDRDPTEVGDTIPAERNVIHFATPELRVWGLTKGQHDFVLVLGDTAHTHLNTNQAPFSVTVNGPTVVATAQGTPEADKAFDIKVDLEDLDFSAGGQVTTTASSGTKLTHLHAIIDPETPPKPGDTIGAAVHGKIIHTTNTTIEIPALAKGRHEIYIVAGDATHNVGTNLVGDKLTITV